MENSHEINLRCENISFYCPICKENFKQKQGKILPNKKENKMIEKFWCSVCPSPCYFEIYFQPGDNKTKESLCCPLNIRVYRIARADRQKGEIKTAEEAKQEGEKTDG